MSGTPSISSSYTVIGGGRRDRVRKYPSAFTVLILSRGDRLFRAELLAHVEALDLGETLWVNGPEHSQELEALSRDFPHARFLRIERPVTAGEMIDIGIGEAHARFVLCMWSDSRIASVSPTLHAAIEGSKAVCALPIIKSSREAVPSYQSPQLRKGKLSLTYRTPRVDGERVFYPFDYCGIYDHERFSRVGGFDPEIPNPYWQKLDFGFRCCLWGESIRGIKALTLLYSSPPAAEDATPDESYKAFYLKNLAVRFKREMGMLPLSRIFEYILHSNTGPFYAFKEFMRAREWVSAHKFLFRRDPMETIQQWEND